MLDIKQITERWEKDEPLFSELGKIVTKAIKNDIPAYEIMPEISHRTKELLSIVKKIKKKQAEKSYSYDNLNDKLGVRIICSFKDDLSKVDDYIKGNFLIKKAEYKQEELDFNKLDYISNHYDLQIKSDSQSFSSYAHLKDLVFELQVRTLNQHAWSNTAHALTYKQELEIGAGFKRRIYRLLSLYEIADDEFSAVNAAMLSAPDNLLYTVLKSLEGKIYKYAKIDYDRETSLYALKKILGFFDDEQKKSIAENLNTFFAQNEKKIKEIYDLNRHRFAEISFLSQPEIFIVWYGLDNCSFTIEDNWNDSFYEDELEQIKALWGKNIE